MQQGKTPEPERVATALAARALGATQTETAEAVEVSHQTVSRWENGQVQHVTGVSAELVQAKETEAVGWLSQLARRLCSKAGMLTEERLDNNPDEIAFWDLVKTFGVGFDKVKDAAVISHSQRHEDAKLVIDASKLPAGPRNLILAAMGRRYDAEELKALEPGE
jgi:transcriptional regulator with XRE-family HTH domain